MKFSPFAFLIFILLFSPLLSIAQGWERKYGSDKDYSGHYVQPTSDGGYILAARSNNAVWGFYYDLQIIKTDDTGNTVWTKTFTDVTTYWGISIQQTTDGGYIAVASEKNNGLLKLIKLSTEGILEWTKIIPFSTPNSAGLHARSIKQTSDGGFVISGNMTYEGLGSGEALLIKTSSNGELTWARTFMISWLRQNESFYAEQTREGGYILTGTSDSGGFIIKTDENGYETWQKRYFEYAFSDIKTANKEDGYVLVSSRIPFLTPNAEAGAYFVKLKNNGDTIFSRYLGAYNVVFLNSIEHTNDGGYCVSGYSTEASSEGKILLIKLKNDGTTEWRKLLGDNAVNSGSSAIQLADGNFILAGTSKIEGQTSQAHVIRTDKLGNVLTNIIKGSIYHDLDNNCEPGALEKRLTNPAYYKIQVSPSNRFAVPDANGNYEIKVDTGVHEVRIINNHPYWQTSCAANYSIAFDKFYETATHVNFGLTMKTSCPLLWVDVAASNVTSCAESSHQVRYCNNGTSDAQDVWVEVFMDPALSFIKSIPAPSLQNGNYFRFNLGTVKAGDCGSINITSTVACGLADNSAVCVKAKIYPDSVCVPVASSWDKSSIAITGRCIGNGLARFSITNKGEDNMNSASEYRFYADNEFIQRNTVQLKSGDSLVFQLNACGKTIRLEADQSAAHPGISKPRFSLEGCTGCGTSVTRGLINTTPADDENAAAEQECTIVAATSMSNNKTVVPSGITSNHFVSSKDELEYRISFQNTSKLTAVNLILRDTINTNVLDIGSLTPGIASHAYTFSISGNILEWKFNGINLPTATTNEKESSGFVKFKIRQPLSLPNNTVISNKAGVYFDANSPVVTAPVTVLVNENVSRATGDFGITIISNTSDNGSELRLAPNPVSSTSLLTVLSSQVSTNDVLTLNVYDVYSRRILTGTFSGMQTKLFKGLLKTGTYYIEVRKGGTRIASTVMMVK
ncbi:MAG: DUF7619 domain-containing protein [Pseudobacter sp.]|uniref:DUF7619 domain-containing protein n=1 Tax=Pseudobacter sp. TaxID=2045420 RepID=UPI003F7DB012